MQMNEAMDFLTAEAVRLEAMGVRKSTVVMSTLTDGGNVARLTITVDIVELVQPTAEPKSIPVPQAPPQMSQQQRYSGGVGGGPNPGPMPGQQQQMPGQR